MAKISLTPGGRTVNGKPEAFDKQSKTYKEINPITGNPYPPAARGDDFAIAFEKNKGGKLIKEGKSINEALDIINARSSSGGGAARAASSSSRRSSSKASTSTDSQSGSTSGFATREAQIGVIQDEAERIQEEIKRLRERERTAAGGVASSDDGPAREEAETATAILNARAVNAPSKEALSTIDAEIKRIEKERKEELDAINKSYDVDKAGVEGQQKSEMGQTSVGIANAGGYLGFSGSGQGVVLNLAKEHRAEMMALQSKRQAAIATANKAINEKRYDLAKLKAEEIARIDTELEDRNARFFQEQLQLMQEKRLKGKEVETTLAEQNQIFEAIQGGATKVEDIFKKLEGKMDVAKINSFLESVTPKKKSGDKFMFSPSETTSLLGTGMSLEDVEALHDFVNENGYTEEVRAQLTSRQRNAADKIYGLKTGTGGTKENPVVGMMNGMEIHSRTMQVLDGFTTLDAMTATEGQKVRDELFAMGFGDGKAPEWFKEMVLSDYPMGTDTPYIDIESEWESYTDSILSGEEYETGGTTEEDTDETTEEDTDETTEEDTDETTEATTRTR